MSTRNHKQHFMPRWFQVTAAIIVAFAVFIGTVWTGLQIFGWFRDELKTTQKEIKETRDQLKAFYEAGKTYSYSRLNKNPKYMAISHEENKHSVYILLEDTPIWQTIQIQWHVAVQPKASYKVNNNLIMFRWGDSLNKLKSKALSVTYVADPFKKTKYESLSKKEERIFADNIPLGYAFFEFSKNN